MSRSLWMAEASSSLPKWERLETSRRESTVIVGAGLAGLGVAQAFRARGVDALIVDAQRPGHGASSRNAGFVLHTHVSAYPAFRKAIGAQLSQELLRLAEENHARIARFAGSAHRATGSLMLATAGDADDARTLREAAALLSSDGTRARIVDPPSALAGFDFAVELPGDGEVHPGALVAALARDLRGALADVHAIDEHGVHFEGGTIDADRIVVATNARLGELVPSLAGIVTPHRAQMLATVSLPIALDRPCYATQGYDYFRQREDGRVLIGGRRHLFFEHERTTSVEPTPEVQSALESYLHEHAPFTRGAAIDQRWAGTMGFTPDSLPIAGPVSDRISVLGGFTGHGLGLSLALADRLVERLLAGVLTRTEAEDDVVLRALAPSRFV